MKKRGISPLIATVLIIGFTILLAVAIINWGQDLVKTLTEETGSKAELELMMTGMNFKLTNGEYDPNTKLGRVLVENKANIDIDSTIIKVFCSDGNVYTTRNLQGIDGLTTKYLTFKNECGKDAAIEKVGVLPQILFYGELKTSSLAQEEFTKFNPGIIEPKCGDGICSAILYFEEIASCDIDCIAERACDLDNNVCEFEVSEDATAIYSLKGEYERADYGGSDIKFGNDGKNKYALFLRLPVRFPKEASKLQYMNLDFIASGGTEEGIKPTIALLQLYGFDLKKSAASYGGNSLGEIKNIEILLLFKKDAEVQTPELDLGAEVGETYTLGMDFTGVGGATIEDFITGIITTQEEGYLGVKISGESADEGAWRSFYSKESGKPPKLIIKYTE